MYQFSTAFVSVVDPHSKLNGSPFFFFFASPSFAMTSKEFLRPCGVVLSSSNGANNECITIRPSYSGRALSMTADQPKTSYAALASQLQWEEGYVRSPCLSTGSMPVSHTTRRLLHEKTHHPRRKEPASTMTDVGAPRSPGGMAEESSSQILTMLDERIASERELFYAPSKRPPIAKGTFNPIAPTSSLNDLSYKNLTYHKPLPAAPLPPKRTRPPTPMAQRAVSAMRQRKAIDRSREFWKEHGRVPRPNLG